MSAPERIQLSRMKGWRMPPNTVKVDRSTMWGNHAAASLGIKDHALAVECFKTWIAETASLAWKGRAKIDLRGKNLACWCKPDQPCHADVLLEVANAPNLKLLAPMPGAEEVAQENANLIQTLQDDLAETIAALKPFAKAHQDLLRALVYPNWQWKPPTTDDYETAQAIVERHR